MTTGLVLGIDVGGTKTHLRVQDDDGRIVIDVVRPTTDWETTLHAKADTLAKLIRDIGGSPLERIVVGAHGCDTDADCAALAENLQARVGVPTVVVNDSLLLGPAAGYGRCISLISGTGSIVLGSDANGSTLYAGGWGWLLGDAGSAWGIVRESVMLLTAAADRGEGDQILLDGLLMASNCANLRDLVAYLERWPAADWATWVSAVFTAAAVGSSLAEEAISQGARTLSALVTTLLQRGAIAEAVVAAGGVIVNQPTFAAKLARYLAHDNGLPLVVHAGAPVAGAVRLAREHLLGVVPT
ncbi:N-acetylglucosamine kinase [Cryobacterium sp. Y82]|uniref:N-acetylglucosamine kinase n=1 Tax=Cryobacterium sp. Y82 TaxID=2045017 RepID=UPI001304A44B|nr:BadF/BadG/BcrA/BcrD ATPase family protein [Cryobacterium sp. Y82]